MKTTPRLRHALAAGAGLCLLAAGPAQSVPASTPTTGTGDTAASATSTKPAHTRTYADRAPTFTPPAEKDIPQGPMGEIIRKGRAIFVDTPTHAGDYVGDGLSCSNCHLDAGRRPNAAPLWAAWVRYPRYRSKNKHVNTFAERLQGCFKYSMNGKAPPADATVLVALQAYAYWLATGAPTGVDLPGAGLPKQGFKPPQPPDYARGQKVFQEQCALCHGGNGQGQRVAGRYVFPPLWGSDSFNWGAGMQQLDNAAAFIKANMPFSRGGTLSDQAAWDVAYFMNSHERPQDPRFTGSVAETRKRYHATPMSLYGVEVNGHLLGSAPTNPARQ